MHKGKEWEIKLNMDFGHIQWRQRMVRPAEKIKTCCRDQRKTMKYLSHFDRQVCNILGSLGQLGEGRFIDPLVINKKLRDMQIQAAPILVRAQGGNLTLRELFKIRLKTNLEQASRDERALIKKGLNKIRTLDHSQDEKEKESIGCKKRRAPSQILVDNEVIQPISDVIDELDLPSRDNEDPLKEKDNQTQELSLEKDPPLREHNEKVMEMIINLQKKNEDEWKDLCTGKEQFQEMEKIIEDKTGTIPLNEWWGNSDEKNNFSEILRPYRTFLAEMEKNRGGEPVTNIDLLRNVKQLEYHLHVKDLLLREEYRLISHLRKGVENFKL
jgi:hypothetical protein